MKRKFKILAITGLVVAFTSCNSSKETTNTNVSIDKKALRGQSNEKHPDASQMLVRMDANKDGKISKTEARGKLKENFNLRDVNEDGYITDNEMRNRKM